MPEKEIVGYFKSPDGKVKIPCYELDWVWWMGQFWMDVAIAIEDWQDEMDRFDGEM